MNSIRIPLLVALVSLAACKRETGTAELVPTKEVVANVSMIDFDSAQGSYSCRAPGEWKTREGDDASADSVLFMDGNSHISVVKYPNKLDRYADAAEYAESFGMLDPKAKSPAVEKKQIGGKTVLYFSMNRKVMRPHSNQLMFEARDDHALIPTAGGFYDIKHAAPMNVYTQTLPVFEAVVRSFKPKN